MTDVTPERDLGDGYTGRARRVPSPTGERIEFLARSSSVEAELRVQLPAPVGLDLAEVDADYIRKSLARAGINLE